MRVFLIILLLLASAAAGGWYLLDQDKPVSEPVASLLPAPATKPAEPAPATPAADVADPSAGVAAAQTDHEPGAFTSDTPPTTDASLKSETAATSDTEAKTEAPAPGGYTSLYPAGTVDHAEATLCFFSFNREVEFNTTRNLVAQMNANSPIKIKVVELVSNDENIKDSIRGAVASGVHCDGVVFTGHHRGKFWGDRTGGSMKAKFIEELSCDSRYAEWFSHVKTLWMEGCHTGTVNPYNDEVDGDKRVRGSPIGMMRAHLDFSDMRGSAADIEDVIEDNLSDENIANDYQRIFPYATILGWSGYAPGEKAGSHYSFPYHIAQVSHLVDPADEYFKDPMHGKLPATAAHRYSEVLYGILKRPDFGSTSNWPAVLNEATFIKGWYNHGNIKMKYALDNGALVTRKALVNSDTELLRQSKALRCVGYQAKASMKAPGGVVAYLANTETITPFASDFFLALMQSGGGVGAETRQKLSRNEVLQRYLHYTTQSSTAPEFRRNNASALLGKLGGNPPQVAQDKASNDTKPIDEQVEEKKPAVTQIGQQDVSATSGPASAE